MEVDTTSTTTNVGDNKNTGTEKDDLVRQRELEAVQALTAGFLENLHQPTEKVTDKLNEIQKSQNALIETIKDAGDLTNVAADIEYIHSVFYNIVEYTYKLEELKKDMGSVSDRVARMKKRAATLQQKKVQVEQLQRERMEKEIQREKDLNAKPSASLSSSNLSSSSSSSIPEATVAAGASPSHRETPRHASVPVILPPSVSSSASSPSSHGTRKKAVIH